MYCRHAKSAVEDQKRDGVLKGFSEGEEVESSAEGSEPVVAYSDEGDNEVGSGGRHQSINDRMIRIVEYARMGDLGGLEDGCRKNKGRAVSLGKKGASRSWSMSWSLWRMGRKGKGEHIIRPLIIVTNLDKGYQQDEPSLSVFSISQSSKSSNGSTNGKLS